MLFDEIDRVSKVVKSLIKQKNIKIISQFDSDGILSTSIMMKALLRENANFELRIIKQLTSKEIEKLNVCENDFLILIDVGSGQLALLKNILDKTQVLILDHHESEKFTHLNLFHVNPLIFGEEETSSSIVCYLFSKSLDIRNVDLVDLAIVGAIADMQDDKWELKGLAKKILEEAEAIGKISVSKGLRLYGRSSRPVYKSLAYSFDPFIPDISGSESQAIQFLSDLGLSAKNDEEWKKLEDLTADEQQKLASAIIVERLKSNEAIAEDIFGEIYNLVGRPHELIDAREFSTVINACGRTNNADIAVRLCLGDLSAIEKSWDIMDDYRKAIGNALRKIREGGMIVSTNFANFIVGGNKIDESIIGTITSIALNSNFADMSKPFFGLAETEDGNVKISARVNRNLKEINIRDIVINAVKSVGGEGGGHAKASGGLIPKGKEKEFINKVDNLLGEMIGSKEK